MRNLMRRMRRSLRRSEILLCEMNGMMVLDYCSGRGF